MIAAATEPPPPGAATADLPRAWWHGCWLEPGHYLFDHAGRDDPGMERCPLGRGLGVGWLDGGLAPRIVRPAARCPVPIAADRIVYRRLGGGDAGLRHRIDGCSDEAPQGDFLLHAIGGCTIAAWWDRTQGDGRGGCNSCLIVEGARSAHEMLELFPRLFPRQAEMLARSGVQLRFLRWAS